MDSQNHRRSLYKEHKEALTPNKHSRLNRQHQEANRNKRRKDLFQSLRNISPSPTPHKASKDKENHVAPHEADCQIEGEATVVKSRTAKVICTARDPEKIKKQEAFILRYLDWKDKKKAMQEKEKRDGHKKRPFVSAVGRDSGFGGKIVLTSKGSAISCQPPSFVPKGHHEFKAPPGLKYPEEVIKEKIKSRQSIYTIVPTPPKKTKSTDDYSNTRKALPSNLHCNLNSNLKKTPARITCDMANNKHSKPVSSSFPKTILAAVATTTGAKTATNSATKPSTRKPKNNLAFTKVSSVDKNSPPTNTATTTTTTTHKPRPLKMPPPPTVPAKKLPPTSSRIRKSEIAAQKITSYCAKSKTTAANKRLESNKPSKPGKNGRNSTQQPQKNARLTQTMKAKKPAKPDSGPTSTKLVSLMLNQVDDIRAVDIQTPRDFSNSNHFEEFVTSTKVKNSNHILEEVNGVSPIEPTAKRSSTSAKRNLLKEDKMNMAQSHLWSHLYKDKSEVDDNPQITRGCRFNFVRYSEINRTINDDEEEVNDVRPIEPTAKRRSTSAKRSLLKEATMNMTQSHLGSHLDKDKSEVVDDKPQITRGSRFNFVRYSEINTTINDDEEAGYEKQKLQDKCQEKKLPQQQEISCSPEKVENITLITERSLQEEKTPTKENSAEEDTPVNYLSPYVSVSRGKVSLKKEKEKRNSIYLASPLSAVEQLNVSIHNNMVGSAQSNQYSTEVRRTLEAVRYYRKQLQEEIDRLHQQCNVWETYKDENTALLQAANVDDMIDVTVGQTRLLTSKKFMQFKGLIDRCEAGATGIGHRPYDGSEATKFISSIDLEGFWSMLGLQVDNLQNRFENLNRWKCNNWRDPEEVKPKVPKPKNLSKVKKKTAAPLAKAKPNSVLQQMLRKIQAEMRNKKANNTLNTTEDILTPSKVRDRKYFSPAATVVGIPTTANRRLSLLGRKNSQDSSTAAINENSPSTFSSPKIQSRKSILKTPGSARTKLRNVIFNQKCRVKKFNFIINDGEGDNVDDPECNESIEEDMKQNAQESDQESESGPTSGCGTYSLRNRKVRLRPSCEIVIPK